MFRAHLAWSDEADKDVTIAWLKQVGLTLPTVPSRSLNDQFFEIQLSKVPEVLNHFFDLQGYLTVTRISSDGVVFYLNDIPLWFDSPEGAQIGTSYRADGKLFCPMGNVVCVNGFGKFELKYGGTSNLQRMQL